MTRLVLALALCFVPLPVLAHKVIAAVFPSGNAIEGEIGLSNGTMAGGLEVTVTGPQDEILGQTVTDDDGFFLFTPTRPVAHRFRADLGAGHVADVTMPAADVAAILGQPVATAAQATPPATSVAASPSEMSDADRQQIAEIVRDEIRPLRREIAATREHNSFQSVLGGIGYIVGLFGIGFYIAARRKLGGQNT